MQTTANFLAADLGASNGRVLLARWDGNRFDLEVVHRFPNGPAHVLDRQYWDVLRQWAEIKAGLGRYAAQHSTLPAGVGVDTWGVDYGLLDAKGQLLGNPVHYRDPRTNGMLDVVFAKVPRREIFAQTGLQFLQLNTLFQLYSMRYHGDPQLDFAATLLMMPDLFNYWLTGRRAIEYTIASTSQMLDARTRRWATGMLAALDLPGHILPAIVEPGAVFGEMLPAVAEEIGMPAGAPIIATGSHDTASAVAAIPGLGPDDVYISSGTWSLMGMEIAAPIITDDVLAHNFTNEGGIGNTIRLLKNITGLWLLQEARTQWQRAGTEYSWEDMLRLAERAQPFRSLVNPDAADFLNPSNMIEAIRSFCVRTGQPAPETPGEIVRCCLESLALRYRAVLASLEALTHRRLATLRVVGGGSQNWLLNRFTADACQCPVITGPSEATALGNIMVQAIATGHLAGIAQGRAAIAASITQESFEPGPVDGWDEAFARFVELGSPLR